jgi:hypothetical protein
MSQADARRITEGSHDAFGRRWWYEYTTLPQWVDDARALEFVRRVEALIGRCCANWTDYNTSEWCIRHYSAARLILSSTVPARSLHYANSHNLRMLIPHGAYYVTYSALRSMVLASPVADGRSNLFLG